MSEFPSPLLSQKQLAEILGVSPRTLERWRSEQQGPPFVQLVRDGKVRYRVDDIARWLEAQAVHPNRILTTLADGRVVESWRSP